jgi:hypothetical protein
MRVPYGSFEEAICIGQFNRERIMDKTRLIASVADPSNADKIIASYEEIAFPEIKKKSLEYMAKGKKMLDKLSKVQLYANEIR